MKRILSILILFAQTLPSIAGVLVHGRVVNAQDGSPLEMVNIRLFAYSGTDSMLITGAQTDAEGGYYLNNIPAGHYRIVASSLGFWEQQCPISVENADLQVPTIRLKEDVQTLNEVDVRGHAVEMVVKGDTIEYNTSAYQVSENAMVEDLLKKMNGVTVDKEGNVTVNGETITGVRIDGKKFFGSDVQTATKNIPADMVDKIQVLDQKSETAKMTGFEDDDTERIINLQLKQNKKRGVFGNYYGGLGLDMVTEDGRWFNYANLPSPEASAWDKTKNFFENDFRYNLGLFTNILLGESQTTIIGSANNTNEIRMGRGRGPFGTQNEGITWSENLGANTNIDLDKHIIKHDNTSTLVFGGDASLSHSYNDSRTQATKESYTSDATLYNADSTNAATKSWDVNGRFELEYQVDTLNYVLIQPTINYTQSDKNSYNLYTYFRDSALINHGDQNQSNLSEDITASVKTIYNHKFLHPGRSLTFTANLGYTNTKGKQSTLSYDYLQALNTVDQHTNSHSDNLNYSLRTSYIEPLYGNNHLLEMALNLSGNNRKSVKDQYSMDTITHQYLYDYTYSNSMDNAVYSEGLELNYQYKQERFDLTAGAKVLATQTHSRTYYGGQLDRDTLYNVWNWSPNVSFRYKFARRQFIRLIYRGTVKQPTIQQMEPVRNNSNAMQETIGNLGLNPAFQHNLRFMFSIFNSDKAYSMMGGIRANLTKDALTNNTIYDETGKVYRQTVNASAGDIPWDVNADYMFNTPLGTRMVQLHSRTAIGYNRRIAYTSSTMTAEEIAAIIEQGIERKGYLSSTGNLNLSEDLNLRFTHDIVDLGLTGRITYSRTQNTISTSNLTNVIDWTVSGDIEFHLPKSWTIGADCGYTGRWGYELDDVNEIMLNASISKTWGNGTLSLRAYDLLNQKKNIVQVISDNNVEYKKFNTLPTYIMLTFTYKLNKMGNLKAQGMAGHIQEMLESGNGPQPGMPSGPPPGMPAGPPPGM